MSKIYLGTNEVANTGGGGGGDYVLNSSFDEMTRVAATALVELKADKADKADVPTLDDMSNVKNDVSSLKSGKADTSTVYSKYDIDNSDKVVAAALASQDARITQLDASVNALEQGGGGITPAQLDASLKAYTYDKVWIDASISSIEPGVSFAQLDASLKAYTYDKAFIDASITKVDASIIDANSSIGDINSSISRLNASVNALEQGGGGGGITPAQLDASLKAYTYDKAFIDASYGYIDTSIKALDASALYFDASIREIAQQGGGGGGGITPAQLDASLKAYTYDKPFIDASYGFLDASLKRTKPIIYTDLSTYEKDVSDGSIDETAMYVITDLADSDELSTLVTIDDLNAEKAKINASLNETADAVITAANSSLNYWSNSVVTSANSQMNSTKNSAISAIQSQQTTSVNAVNTAGTNNVNAVNTAGNTKIAEMPTFLVMTEAEYEQITTPDPSTIYFLKAQ